MHVLFKYRDYYCLASYDVEQGIPSYSDHKLDAKEYREIKITPIPSTDRDNSKIREIKLNLVSCNDDYDLCKTA